MLEQTDIKAVGTELYALIEAACRKGLPCLPSAEEVKRFEGVFGDADLTTTCLKLFENDLNVSRTAKALYMHRNTLIYRIAKIKRLTGLDVTSFKDAAAFVIRYGCYREWRRLR